MATWYAGIRWRSRSYTAGVFVSGLGINVTTDGAEGGDTDDIGCVAVFRVGPG